MNSASCSAVASERMPPIFPGACPGENKKEADRSRATKTGHLYKLATRASVAAYNNGDYGGFLWNRVAAYANYGGAVASALGAGTVQLSSDAGNAVGTVASDVASVVSSAGSEAYTLATDPNARAQVISAAYSLQTDPNAQLQALSAVGNVIVGVSQEVDKAVVGVLQQGVNAGKFSAGIALDAYDVGNGALPQNTVTAFAPGNATDSAVQAIDQALAPNNPIQAGAQRATGDALVVAGVVGAVSFASGVVADVAGALTAADTALPSGAVAARIDRATGADAPPPLQPQTPPPLQPLETPLVQPDTLPVQPDTPNVRPTDSNTGNPGASGADSPMPQPNLQPVEPNVARPTPPDATIDGSQRPPSAAETTPPPAAPPETAVLDQPPRPIVDDAPSPVQPAEIAAEPPAQPSVLSEDQPIASPRPIDTEPVSREPISPEPVKPETPVGPMEGATEPPFANEACFAAGTPVQTASGPKPIELLEPGDWVFARNQFNPAMAPVLRRVLQIFRLDGKVLVDVSLQRPDGRRESITATTQHPFYLCGHGWQGASDLLPGDELAMLNGECPTVVAVTRLEGEHRVYNFEVDTDHTYFVGDAGVWVHNASTIGDALRETQAGEGPNTTAVGELGSRPASSSSARDLLKRQLQAQEIANPGESMSGPVVLRDPVVGATAAQQAQIRQYAEIGNLVRDEGYLSPTGRVSTSGATRALADRAAQAERIRAAEAGTPYAGVAGHGIDTTWTNLPKAPFWQDLDGSINSSLGRQARDYPIGYKPTSFVYERDILDLTKNSDP